MVPVGFILTMYTETGYDASAHTAEETRGAAIAAAQGVWRSIFYSAIIGWVLLLAFLFAANDVGAVNDGAGFVGAIFTSALDSWAAKLVVIITTIGQLFCGAAGLTSASRTWYAFSRDRAIPGWAIFRRVNSDKVPFNSVIAVSVFSLIVAIPALFGRTTFRSRSSRSPGSARSASRRLPHPGLCGCGRRQVQAWAMDPGKSPKVVNIIALLFGSSMVSPSTCRTRRPGCPGTAGSTRAW